MKVSQTLADKRRIEQEIRGRGLIFRRLFRRVVLDQEGRILRKIPLITKPTLSNVMDREYEDRVIGLAMRPFYITTITDSANGIFEEFPESELEFEKAIDPMDALDANIFKYADQYSIAMAKYVNKTTAGKIKRIIREGLKERLHYSEIARKIKTNIFKDLREGVRARRLAHTEAHGMVENGRQRGAEVNKVIKSKSWSAAADARETHGDANAQTVPKEEPYFVGGFQLMFPGDTSLGADLKEIINCRCSSLFSSKVAEKVQRLGPGIREIGPHNAPTRKHIKIPTVQETEFEADKLTQQFITELRANGYEISEARANGMMRSMWDFAGTSGDHMRRIQMGILKPYRGKYGQLAHYRAEIRDIEAYLKMAQKYEKKMIYRGINFEGDPFAIFKKGQVIDMRGTSHFSSSNSQAQRFMSGKGFVFEVENKTGVSIRHLVTYGEESEIMMSSKVKFKILKMYKEIDKKGKAITRILLEEITPKVPRVVIVPKPIIPKAPKLETLLKEGKIESTTTKGFDMGANKTMKIHIKGDGDACFKPVGGENWRLAEKLGEHGTMAERERAAYLISKEMGLDNVPATVLRKIKGELGSAQSWVEKKTAELAQTANYKKLGTFMKQNKDKLKTKMEIFDALIENTDRHLGNYLMGKEKLIYIDNGYSLPDALSKYTKYGRTTSWMEDELVELTKHIRKYLTKKDVTEYITKLKAVKSSVILEKEMIKLNLRTEYRYMIERGDLITQQLSDALEYVEWI